MSRSSRRPSVSRSRSSAPARSAKASSLCADSSATLDCPRFRAEREGAVWIAKSTSALLTQRLPTIRIERHGVRTTRAYTGRERLPVVVEVRIGGLDDERVVLYRFESHPQPELSQVVWIDVTHRA